MKNGTSSARTHNYHSQIKGSLVCKMIAILVSLLSMRLMIEYLGQEQFGVWSTLLSILSWCVFFDLGISNGLRYKVAQAMAENDKQNAANYIASGYVIIGAISFLLLLIIIGVSFFLPWQLIFNTKKITEVCLRETIQIASFFLILNFWMGLVNGVLGSLQKTAITSLSQLVCNVLVLVSVFLLIKTTKGLIFYLAFTYGLSLVITSLGLNYWFYRTHIELLVKPKIKFIKQHIPSLLSVGLQFFVIQIAVLVVFTTDKLVITQLLGPSYVTEYDIVFKLFSLISFFHGLISSPLWSAYTDAFHRGDIFWVKLMLRKQLMIFGAIILLTIILAFFIKNIIAIWINKELVVSTSLVISVAIFVVISCWNNIYAMFINGIGEVKLQLYTSILAMVINVPLAIFFVKTLNLGLSGVMMATVISLLGSAIALPIQVNKIISKQ